MSNNDHRDDPARKANLEAEEPELELGEIMDYYREELRVLRERRKRALAEAEVALKLARR